MNLQSINFSLGIISLVIIKFADMKYSIINQDTTTQESIIKNLMKYKLYKLKLIDKILNKNGKISILNKTPN
jgi:hypothetical protein